MPVENDHSPTAHVSGNRSRQPWAAWTAPCPLLGPPAVGTGAFIAADTSITASIRDGCVISVHICSAFEMTAGSGTGVTGPSVGALGLSVIPAPTVPSLARS